MLVTVSRPTSRQSLRSIRSGTFSTAVTAHSTGSPSHIDSERNVSGGKPVTPTFMTGQFRPQATVSSDQQHELARGQREGGSGRVQLRPR